ncbi:MAG: DUF6171 family protein [Bacillota bacterium]
MSESGDCKGCSASVNLSEKEIEEIFGDLEGVREIKVVTEKVYQDRLAVCEQCQYFVHGSTCRQCGCIMKIKAKLKGATCPHPGGEKWE